MSASMSTSAAEIAESLDSICEINERLTSREELLRFTKALLQPLYNRRAVSKSSFISICKGTLSFVLRHPVASDAWRPRFVREIVEMQLALVLKNSTEESEVAPAAVSPAINRSAPGLVDGNPSPLPTRPPRIRDELVESRRARDAEAARRQQQKQRVDEVMAHDGGRSPAGKSYSTIHERQEAIRALRQKVAAIQKQNTSSGGRVSPPPAPPSQPPPAQALVSAPHRGREGSPILAVEAIGADDDDYIEQITRGGAGGFRLAVENGAAPTETHGSPARRTAPARRVIYDDPASPKGWVSPEEHVRKYGPSGDEGRQVDPLTARQALSVGAAIMEGDIVSPPEHQRDGNRQQQRHEYDEVQRRGGGGAPPPWNVELRFIEQRQSCHLAESSERALLAQSEANAFLHLATLEASLRPKHVPKQQQQQPATLHESVGETPRTSLPSPIPASTSHVMADHSSHLVAAPAAAPGNMSLEEWTRRDPQAAAMVQELEEQQHLISELSVAVQSKVGTLQKLLAANNQTTDVSAAGGAVTPQRRGMFEAPPAVAAVAEANARRQAAATRESPYGPKYRSRATTPPAGTRMVRYPPPRSSLSPSPSTSTRRVASPAASHGGRKPTTPSRTAPHKTPPPGQLNPSSGPSRIEVVEHIRTVLQPAYDSGKLPKAAFAEIVRTVSVEFFGRSWRSETPADEMEWKGFLNEKLRAIGWWSGKA